MAIGAGLGPTQAVASSVIGLACVPLSERTADLCAELRDLIAASTPAHQVVVLAPDDLPADRPALRLTILTLRNDGVAGQLDWRRSGQDWQIGEHHQSVVMDAQLTKAHITRFLQSLWTDSAARF